jgi:hypothetical protein
MADGKGTARARGSRPAQTLVSQGNRVNVALPFSVIRAEEPVTMRARDWIGLAGLVVSAVGFSVVIREVVRIAHASEGGQVSHQETSRINARFAAEVEAAWKAYEKSDRRDDRALADAVKTAILERQDRLLSHGLIPYPTVQAIE